MISSLKSIIGNSKTLFVFRVLKEKISEAFFLLPRLSTGFSDWRKIEPRLRVEIHAIEKGMSIGAVRAGFGKAKVVELLKHLQRYCDVGGRKAFVAECCSILDKYLEYNKSLGADMSDVEDSINAFNHKNDINIGDFGGIREINETDIRASLDKGFDVFSQSRYAVRDYGTSIIKREQIEKALKLAEKTPSACNRQSWKIHVYHQNDVRLKMFEQQGGNRGFSQDMQYAILICGDLNYYRFYELSQVYVDGGIYAMNLMYALHYSGVATIPLTMSIRMSMLKPIIKAMDLPVSEVPVLLIGVGSYKEHFKVAKSERVPYQEYTSFDK